MSKSKPKLVIAVAHGGRPIPVDWYISMQLLAYPTNSGHVNIWRKGVPNDVAMNEMAQHAVLMGAQYFMTIDDDTQIPPDAILYLLKELENADDKTMACGGIYTTRTNPPEPICYKEFHGGPYWDWRLGDVFECFAVGDGCRMVKTELFTKIPPPWYKWIHSAEELAKHVDVFPESLELRPDEEVNISPDIYFAKKLQHYGYKTLAHGGVLPLHWDVLTNTAYWMPANTKPTRGITLPNGEPFGWTPPAEKPKALYAVGKNNW